MRTTRPPLVAGDDRKKCPPRARTIMPICSTYIYSLNKTLLGLGYGGILYYIILLCIVRACVFVCHVRERALKCVATVYIAPL